MKGFTSKGRHIIRIEKSTSKQAIPVLNKTHFTYTSLKLSIKMSELEKGLYSVELITECTFLFTGRWT